MSFAQIFYTSPLFSTGQIWTVRILVLLAVTALYLAARDRSRP